MNDLNKLKDIDYSDIPIAYKVIILSLIERTEIAEAELARRDAAAPPAVLPGNARDSFEHWYHTYMGTPVSVLVNLRTDSGYIETEGDRLNISWKAYQRATQQKPVVLPLPEVAKFGRDHLKAYAQGEVLAALDAANVKWEVKK